MGIIAELVKIKNKRRTAITVAYILFGLTFIAYTENINISILIPDDSYFQYYIGIVLEYLDVFFLKSFIAWTLVGIIVLLAVLIHYNFNIGNIFNDNIKSNKYWSNENAIQNLGELLLIMYTIVGPIYLSMKYIYLGKAIFMEFYQNNYYEIPFILGTSVVYGIYISADFLFGTDIT